MNNRVILSKPQRAEESVFLYFETYHAVFVI